MRREATSEDRVSKDLSALEVEHFSLKKFKC